MRKNKPSKDITGMVYHYLTAIRYYDRNGNVQFWLFKCRCGKETVINKSKVTSGSTKSCGCYQREVAKKDSTTHGLANHPIWRLWRDIRNRCYIKNVKHYHLYGGRGVVMCDEWKNNFMSFYNWCVEHGWRSGLQIDKDIIAKELGIEPLLYSPERCQFVTPKKNANNRRSNRNIEYNGVIKTLAEWSETTGINHGTLHSRLERGWPIDRAFLNGKFNKYTKWD